MLLTFKFLGIMIDDTLMCKTHSKMITPKLSSACYAVRPTKTFCIAGYFKNDVPLLFLFHYEIWYYSVGELYTE